MRSILLSLGTLALLAPGCARISPDANPEFSDATVFALRAFAGDEADLAYALRVLERQTYLGLDVEASGVTQRSVIPAPLSFDDVADLEIPDGVDPADSLAITVASVSAFEIGPHADLTLLPDQTPLEPYSPNFYERTFLNGSEACWTERACEVLYTHNDLIKDNLLMTVRYDFLKDYRWVDLNQPDPEDADEEEVTGEPRWAFLARSWMTESALGDNGNNELVQFYSIEAWIPRDGRGFVRDGTEENVGEGEWTADATGGGVMRVLSLWSTTVLGGMSVSDEMVIGTTRVGIDNNMKAHESYLVELFK